MSVLFHYLALLNLADGLLTYYGLENGLIAEMDPLMAWLYEMDAGLFLVLKVCLSIFLYLFIVFKIVPTTATVKGMTAAATLLYTCVFGLHCLWVL